MLIERANEWKQKTHLHLKKDITLEQVVDIIFSDIMKKTL